MANQELLFREEGMTLADAREQIQRIKTHWQAFWFELKAFHDRQGWTALGYTSFKDCMAKELGLGESRAYEYLYAAQIRQELDTSDVRSIDSMRVGHALALKQLQPTERIEVARQVDFSQTPVRELRQIVKQAKEALQEQADERRQQRAEAEQKEPVTAVLLPSPVQILCRDARDLAPVPTGSIHLVVTSPPYNVGKDYRMYEDNKSLAGYLAMLDAVWSECERVLVAGGRIAVNVPHGTDRNPYFPIGAHITLQLAQRFELLGSIIWDKGTTGNRTSWGSWRQPTAPSLRDTCELVIVAAKPGRFEVPAEVWRVEEGQRVSPWLDSETFTALTQDHWQIAPESAQRVGHPAPFPVELAERLLRLYAFPGATVLDPFAGSGTVGVAAIRLGAAATLVDVDEEYCRLARRRCHGENGSAV